MITEPDTIDRGSAPAPAPERDVPPVVRAFLELIRHGQGGRMGHLYTPEATADLTVPNWRFHRHGPAAIVDEYAGWFASEGSFEELEIQPTPTGAVVTYLLCWEEGGVPHAAHHVHVLDLDHGLIARDTVFCGGRWSAALLAEMEEAAGAS